MKKCFGFQSKKGIWPFGSSINPPSISESLPQKYVDHLPGTAGERGKKTLNGQKGDSPGKYPNMKPAVRMKDSVANKTVRMKNFQTSSPDLSTELDLEMVPEEEQEKLDEDENNHSQVEEEKHNSGEVEVSDNVCGAADESGLIQQRESGGDSNQEFFAVENKGSDRPAKKTPCEKKKVKEQINDMNNLDDLTQLSETVSEDLLYSTNSTLQVGRLDLEYEVSDSLWKIMLHLQDQMLLDVAKLESNSEMFSQQLYKAESKFNKLNIKLHQKRVDLREKTLMLECVQRDLGQTECQKQETELMYQNEQGKVNEYLRKPESLEERLSLLQSENMLLRQQLDDAQNKANSQERTVISIQDQLLQIMKKLHAENDKQCLMLEERNKELINKQNHLKERMCQYENEKAEEESKRAALRVPLTTEALFESFILMTSHLFKELSLIDNSLAVVRQLRQELTDALKKQPMSEASPQVMSHYRANLEAEAQDLKRKLHQLPSQIQAAAQENLEQLQDQNIASIRSQKKLRINDLESEVSKMKTSHDSNKTELEKYKKLCLEQVKTNKSLESKLDKKNERLAEMSTKLEVKQQQSRSLLRALTTRPVLEPPCIGNFNNTEMFNTNLCPRAKMQQELEKSRTRELEEGAAEFESEYF